MPAPITNPSLRPNWGMTMIDRRSLIVAAMAATAARAARLGRDSFDKWIVVNALGGLGDPNPGPSPAFSPRVLAEAHASGLTMVNITLGYVSGTQDPFEESV